MALQPGQQLAQEGLPDVGPPLPETAKKPSTGAATTGSRSKHPPAGQRRLTGQVRSRPHAIQATWPPSAPGWSKLSVVGCRHRGASNKAGMDKKSVMLRMDVRLHRRCHQEQRPYVQVSLPASPPLLRRAAEASSPAALLGVGPIWHPALSARSACSPVRLRCAHRRWNLTATGWSN